MTFASFKGKLFHGPGFTKQIEQPEQVLPTRSFRSPLEIPEIIEQVFSYLASSHIRFGPCRVCRLWRSISLRYITNTTFWNSSKHTENISLQARFAERLRVTDKLVCKMDQDVAPLGNIIESLSSEELQRLKTLVVRNYTEPCITYNNDIFKPFKSLTCLCITLERHFDISLYRILSTYPNLRRLGISATYRSGTVVSTLCRYPPGQPWPTTTRHLRSLVFQYMTVDITLLEEFLRFCPDLKELKLVMIQPENLNQPNNPNPATSTSTQISSLDCDHHFPIISSCCPRLQSFHYSERDSHTNSERLPPLVRKSFPCLSSWSTVIRALHASDPLRVFGRQFIHHTNHLSTLELLAPTGTENSCLRTSFHWLLCNSPNLLHIRARNVKLNTRFMGTTSKGNIDIEDYGIWACHNLRTFQVSLKPMDDCAIEPMEKQTLPMRNFFAYLVKCCPRLEDIRIEQSDLRLNPETGLCLLSELGHLERLHITTTCQKVYARGDFGWLSTEDFQNRPLRVEEALYKLKGMESAVAGLGIVTGLRGNSRGERLVLAIKEASKFYSVVKMLDGIRGKQSRGEYCWPHLVSLTFTTGGIGLTPLIRSLRPHLNYRDNRITKSNK